ncbi:zinc-binding dehydrogenase [Thermodesulfobacteriota bacterium]
MKAAFAEKPGTLTLKEMETPSTGPEQILVRVLSTGICGSDLESYHGQMPTKFPPVIPGHECAGVVAQVGTKVTTIAPGTRVALVHQVACGRCPSCQEAQPNLCDHRISMGCREWPGSFAEFVLAPESAAVPLPEGVSNDVGALIEPLAVGIHIVRRAGVRLGDSVMVLGSGAIGLSCIMAAKAAGAGLIMATDVFDFNLRKARKIGAIHTANARLQDVAALAKELTGGRGVDQAIVAVPVADVLEQAITSTRKQGTVVLVASFNQPITVNLWTARRGEQHLIGSLSYDESDFRVAVTLASERQTELESLATHHFPLSEIHRAIQLAENRSEGVIRIMVHP